MKSVLFVCTGNICRSSMAEGILRDFIEKDELLKGKWEVSSAGTSAYQGEAASRHSCEVVKREWGIDLLGHRSRRITSELVHQADLILTMTRDHKRVVLSQYPASLGKVYTLKEYVADGPVDNAMESYNFSLDIADPYGMSVEVYKHCAYEIREAVLKLIDKLKKTT